MAPALLVLLGVLAYPIASSILLGFQDVTIAPGGINGEWIGLANYERMLSDPAVGIALRNSLYFTFVEVIAVVVISLAVALLLNHPSGRNGLFLIILLIPWALAP
ncbi:MAG: carbohydrate ABC transporter permease, partial [Chloroflexota bacterium]